MSLRTSGLAAAIGVALLAGPARADPPRPAPPPPARDGELALRADALDADLRTGALTLRGGVVLRYGRYRLTGDRLVVVATPAEAPRVVDVRGTGRVAACPCPDPPLALAFSGARLEAGGDLVVRSPRVELFGAPIFWLPALWLRPADRVGLLPPQLEWRGEEGLVAGAGVHLPLGGHGDSRRALDVRAAGATAGGAVFGAALHAPEARLDFGWDEVLGRRVLLRGQGAIAPDDATAIAFSADAIRGDRARRGTVDLGEAAAPFDDAALETSFATVPYAGASGLVATGLAAEAPRGESEIAAGPSAFAGFGGPLGDAAAWDASATGFLLRDPVAAGAIPLARGALDVEIDPALGPIDTRIGVLGGARVAMPSDGGRATDASAAARAEVSLPLVRHFGRYAHLVAPTIAMNAAISMEQGTLFDLVRAPAPPVSLLATGGVDTRVAEGPRGIASASLRGGALAERGWVTPVAIAGLALDGGFLGASARGAIAGGGADTFVRVGHPGDARQGAAVVARARIGPPRVVLGADTVLETGGGAQAAWALASGDAAALPTDRLWILRDRAATGGADLSIAWTRSIRSTVRADADLLAPALLAERATLAYRHPCGCLGLSLTGAHRVARHGVDVWAAVDLAPP